MSELFDVSDKAVVVTGGSRGIGFMIARGFVQGGARVYITARKAEACDAAAAELGKEGTCVSIPADLADPAAAQRFVDAVVAQEPALHVLVNNAGATWGAPMEEFPDSAFDKVFDINVKAVFNLTRLFLPSLRAAATADDPARVINIGSIDGIRVNDMDAFAYGPSKAAVHMMTRHLAHKLAGQHITVNAIAPGPFESKMMNFVLGNEAGRNAVAASVPLGRIGRPDDMAGAAIFLASRAGSYLTGTVIPVDGGISTHG
jgi:NAD(P)-dependent dehydrogenase (short-subunit alcohol dehydrogenase family)